MKRRLSVAMALLGNPKIVYLDEPTTGARPYHAAQPPPNCPTAGGGVVKCDPIVLGRAGPVLGSCWAVLCRAGPRNRPNSTPAAHAGPYQVPGVKG
jgi:hypothetical protein